MEEKTLTTASGKQFDEAWDGISTIDGVLRIGLVGADIDEVHETFKSPAETARLIRTWSGEQSEYAGYTDYRGFIKSPGGEIIVSLGLEDPNVHE